MKIVQKGNKQLRIANDRLEDFLSKGYVEIDEKTGKALKPKVKDSVTALKEENAALKKANEDLTKQVADLTAKAEQ